MDESWLLRAHPRWRLEDWARRLRHTRFVRALGGHANDGDFLALSLGHAGGDDLQGLLSALGAAPGHTRALGHPAFLVVRADRVEIHLGGAAGDPYEVSEADVAHAEALEAALGPLAERILDPPLPGDRVVSPETFPEIFGADD